MIVVLLFVSFCLICIAVAFFICFSPDGVGLSGVDSIRLCTENCS